MTTTTQFDKGCYCSTRKENEIGNLKTLTLLASPSEKYSQSLNVFSEFLFGLPLETNILK